jgi:uncharacterized protein DUF1559
MRHGQQFLFPLCRYATRTSLGMALVIVASCLTGIDRCADDARADEAPKPQQTARMKASVAKMKGIGLALLNYENKFKHFPPAVVIGPDGKTPHSWRVEMLPALGRQDLFDRYKMDEPWDSKNNLAVAAAAADLFSAANDVGDEGSAECAYFLLTGPSTPFDGGKTTGIRKIIDGTANTVGLVEAKRPVPWTEPEDIAYDPTQPLPKLGGFFDGGFHVAMLDCSVIFLPEGIDEKTLRAMFTHAGRERLQRSSAHPWPELAK